MRLRRSLFNKSMIVCRANIKSWRNWERRIGRMGLWREMRIWEVRAIWVVMVKLVRRRRRRNNNNNNSNNSHYNCKIVRKRFCLDSLLFSWMCWRKRNRSKKIKIRRRRRRKKRRRKNYRKKKRKSWSRLNLRWLSVRMLIRRRMSFRSNSKKKKKMRKKKKINRLIRS